MSLSDWLKSRRALQRLLIAAELRAEASLVRAQLAERRNAEYGDPKTPRERVEAAEATAAAAVSVAEEAERQRDLWCAKYEALRDGPLLPPPPPDRTPEETDAMLRRHFPASRPPRVVRDDVDATLLRPFCMDCECPHPVGEHTKVSA